MCTAPLLNVVYERMKFNRYTFNTLLDMLRTKLFMAEMGNLKKGNNSMNMSVRVMNRMHYTSRQCTLISLCSFIAILSLVNEKCS